MMFGSLLLILLTFISLCFDAQRYVLAAPNATLKIFPSGLIVPRVEDAVNLTCQVMTTSERDPTLYKLEWNVPTSKEALLSRINVTKHRNALTLYISGVQEGDSGIYLCTASNQKEGTLVSNVTIAVVPKKGTCSRGFFVCGTKECIANRFLCDGRSDCPDGSDEAVEHCGRDPCSDKITCDDGRCLDRKLCCDDAYEDMCHIDRLPLCCIKYLNSKLVNQQTSYESDMGFLQSTIYTIVGCAIAFIFIVIIMVVAVCRVHMKQAAMSPHPSGLVPVRRNSLYWGQRSPQDLESYVRDANGNPHLQQLPYATPTNLLITCNISNGVQLVGHIVEPPPYSEVAEEPPNSNDPPPPYSSTENLSRTAPASSAGSTGVERCGRSNSALLRPNVLVNRAEDNR